MKIKIDLKGLYKAITVDRLRAIEVGVGRGLHALALRERNKHIKQPANTGG